MLFPQMPLIRSLPVYACIGIRPLVALLLMLLALLFGVEFLAAILALEYLLVAIAGTAGHLLQFVDIQFLFHDS